MAGLSLPSSALAASLEAETVRRDPRASVKQLVKILGVVESEGSYELPASEPEPCRRAKCLFFRSLGLSTESRDGVHRVKARTDGEGEQGAGAGAGLMAKALGAVDGLLDFTSEMKWGKDGAMAAMGCAARTGCTAAVVRAAGKELPTLPEQLPDVLEQLRNDELVDVDGIENPTVQRWLMAIFDTVGLDQQTRRVEEEEGNPVTAQGYALPRSAEGPYAKKALGLLIAQLQGQSDPERNDVGASPPFFCPGEDSDVDTDAPPPLPAAAVPGA